MQKFEFILLNKQKNRSNHAKRLQNIALFHQKCKNYLLNYKLQTVQNFHFKKNLLFIKPCYFEVTTCLK